MYEHIVAVAISITPSIYFVWRGYYWFRFALTSEPFEWQNTTLLGR